VYPNATDASLKRGDTRLAGHFGITQGFNHPQRHAQEPPTIPYRMHLLSPWALIYTDVVVCFYPHQYLLQEALEKGTDFSTHPNRRFTVPSLDFTENSGCLDDKLLQLLMSVVSCL
jgi:hypothetical protein